MTGIQNLTVWSGFNIIVIWMQTGPWHDRRGFPHSGHSSLILCPSRISSEKQLTVLVQEELVEAQAAGLLPDEAVHVLGAVVVHRDGVLQWLHTRLQAEGDLGVAYRVSEEKQKQV